MFVEDFMRNFLLLSILLVFMATCYADDIQHSSVVMDSISQKDEDKEIFYTEVPRGLILSVSDNLLFMKNARGEIVINPKAYVFICELVNVLHKINNQCVIEGHSDSSPTLSNWEFSIMKADMITEYILNMCPKLQNRIFSVGFGSNEPFSSEIIGHKCKKLNNRIDFVIIDYSTAR